MHVGVLGCGSLGGVIAAGLAAHRRVTVINRNREIAAAWARDGLRVRGPAGRRGAERVARPALVERPGEAGAPFDLVVLTTQSGGLEEAARALLPFLAPGGFLVTTQNGLVGLDLAADPALPVLPGAVLWGASMEEPGLYRVTARGPFILGESAVPSTRLPARSELPGAVHGATAGSARLERAAAVLSVVFPVRRSADIRGVLWSKLAITASFTTLGAISGLRFGELVRRADTRALLLAIGMEVGRVALAEGVRLEPLGGGLDMRRLLLEPGYPRPVKDALMRLVGHRHRRTSSSMLAALRRGRRTEIDFINGRVARLAEAHGLDAPLNRRAAALVAELEAGRLSPAPANLEALGLPRGA